MGMKYQIDKLEEVPEASRALYVAKDGKYVLDVDGVVAKDKLDEFRNNNINLQQQMDKLKHIDPVKYQELLQIDQKVKEKQLIDKGDVDGLVNLRTQAMKEDLEGKLNSSTSELSKARSQLDKLLIDNQVKTVAIKLGVHETAVDDVVLRGRASFIVKEGTAISEQDGKVVYGKDGTTPLGIDEWMTGLKKSAPHLFKGSQGSGASGGNGQSGGKDLAKMTPAEKIAYGMSQGGLQRPPTELNQPS